MKTSRLSVQLIVITGVNIIFLWGENGISPKSAGNVERWRGGAWIAVVKLKVVNAGKRKTWQYLIRQNFL